MVRNLPFCVTETTRPMFVLPVDQLDRKYNLAGVCIGWMGALDLRPTRPITKNWNVAFFKLCFTNQSFKTLICLFIPVLLFLFWSWGIGLNMMAKNLFNYNYNFYNINNHSIMFIIIIVIIIRRNYIKILIF